MNINAISRNVGVALVFNAAFMFICVITSVIYGFDSAFSPLFLSAILTFTTGIFPLVFVKQSYDFTIREGYMIIVLSWLLCCLFGMLPYVLWGGEFSLVNAFYESVSGYTTTGATILTNVEALPKSLLLWRSSTHFIGGIGVVIFMLLILPSVSTFRLRLSKIEISELSKENYKYKAQETVKVIAAVYVGLTIAEIFCLLIAGMDFFDAVNHSFSTVSTGGFSTRNASIAAYNSAPVEFIITLFMLLSGLHFGLLYATFIKGSFKILKSPIIIYYLSCILASTIIISANLYFSGTTDTVHTAFREAVFQVVSFASTTGFATANTALWPNVSILILIFLSIQCACSGSTTGGIKANRVLIFFKSIGAQMKKQIHPNGVIHVKIGDRILEPELVSSVNLFIVFYLLIVLIVTFLLSAMGMSMIDSFTASVANMGNVGPGFGTVGSFGNYSAVPIMGKIILSIEMLLGRLEIYSLIIIFFIHKWR